MVAKLDSWRQNAGADCATFHRLGMSTICHAGALDELAAAL